MSGYRRWLAAAVAASCLSCGASPASDAAGWTAVTSARGAVSLSLPPDLQPGGSFRLDQPAGEGLVFVDPHADPGSDPGSVYVTRQLAIDAEGANPDSTFARILTYTVDRLEFGPDRPECDRTRLRPVEGGEFHGRLTVWTCPGDERYLEVVAVSADRTVALRLDLSRPSGSDTDTDSAAMVARILGSVVVDREAVPLVVQAGGGVLGR